MREAMKKPEFCKLLAEYVQEISDPENKKVNLTSKARRPVTLYLFFREMKKNS